MTTFDVWGFVLDFLDADDPRPAREQFNERYQGGWEPAPQGLSFDHDTATLSYPGDPIMRPLSCALYRDEVLLLFPHSLVVIVQQDGSWEAARMD